MSDCPSPACQRNGCPDWHDEAHEATLGGQDLVWFYRRLSRYYRLKFEVMSKHIAESVRQY